MFVLHQDYEAAIARITQLLANVNLQTTRTFDLKAACADHPGGVCPHHGTAPCDCQMTVLLVYRQSSTPVALTVRKCDSQTWFSIADSPQQADPQLESMIWQALVAEMVHGER